MTGSCDGAIVVLGRVDTGGQHGAGPHLLDDPVAANHHRRVGRDHEPRRAVRQLFLDRVADEVVRARGLHQPGEDRGLGEGELVEADAPVAARGGRDAVAVVAEEVVVQVGRDDLLLALLAGEGLGQADRLDDLADLALIGGREGGLGQEPVAHQLLGDRGSPAGPAGERVEPRRDDAEGIEAGVLPEGLVLDGRGRVNHHRRDLVEGHDVPPLAGEGREGHLPGAVVDARLFVELDVAEDLRRIGEALAVVREGRDGAREPGGAHDEERGEEKERDGDGDAGDGARPGRGSMAGAVPATALPPREAGLHVVGHDSIEGMDSRSVPPGRFDACKRRRVTP